MQGGEVKQMRKKGKGESRKPGKRMLGDAEVRKRVTEKQCDA